MPCVKLLPLQNRKTTFFRQLIVKQIPHRISGGTKFLLRYATNELCSQIWKYHVHQDHLGKAHFNSEKARKLFSGKEGLLTHKRYGIFKFWPIVVILSLKPVGYNITTVLNLVSTKHIIYYVFFQSSSWVRKFGRSDFFHAK